MTATDAAGSTITPCLSCGTKNRVPQAGAGRLRCARCHADLPWLVDADDRSFDAAVVRSSLPVLVDIWAAWCGPCRAVAPIVEQLAVEHAGRLKVVKVDADRSPRVSASHGVTGIPTLLFYDGGAERDRLVGAPPAARLREWVRSAMQEASSAA